MNQAFFAKISTYLPFAREGYPFLAFSLALALLFSFVSSGVALLLWLLFFFFLQFYRDPPRHVPQGQGIIISPADGKVIAIERCQDPYRKGQKSQKISIFMHAFNVHRTRVPHAGVVQQRQDFAGSFLNAALDKASEQNERTALVIASGDWVYTCVQVAGLLARRIVCYAHVGDALEQGAPYGFIHFGSRLDVYLPEEVHINVGLGDKVKGGESIIAQLI
jgi:phosphatidylserine decarboxylase